MATMMIFNYGCALAFSGSLVSLACECRQRLREVIPFFSKVQG
jgi:hypothetical protein